MKITSSIREVYSFQLEVNSRLKSWVDERIIKDKPDKWFYISRLKEQESFALKLETGRFSDISEMEDFFACSIIVPNSSKINDAFKFIEKHFKIKSRRPKQDELTHLAPDSFEFDELRLYCSQRENDSLPPKIFDEIIFEVQIKTFLQYAWGIATHDLIYKGKDISWAKARVAFQIKALLEYAEVSIEKVEEISSSSALAKENKQISQIKKIINFVVERWDPIYLPQDLNRLAGNIGNILSGVDISIEALDEAIKSETAKGRGIKLINLPPYGIVLQSVINYFPSEFEKYLNRSVKKTKAILLLPEIELSEKISTIISKAIAEEKINFPLICIPEPTSKPMNEEELKRNQGIRKRGYFKAPKNPRWAIIKRKRAQEKGKLGYVKTPKHPRWANIKRKRIQEKRKLVE